MTRVSLICALGLITAAPAGAETIRVPRDQPTIQAGIDAAGDGDLVLVAPGVYKETIDFVGKAITVRGKAGREWTVLDGNGLPGTVVSIRQGEGPDSVLEGFTITGGTGEGYRDDAYAGGMYIVGASPTIVDCAFVENTLVAGGDGVAAGAAIDCSGGSPRLIRCLFARNSAVGDEGDWSFGGAIFNEYYTHMTLIDCEFEENSAIQGGAVCNYYGSTTQFSRCTFRENTASYSGGGLFGFTNSFSVLQNCLIVGSVAHTGAAVNGESNATIEMSNCTLANNVASYVAGAIAGRNSATTLLNCVLWGNGVNAIDGDVAISYSNVEGGWPGEGNIDADPLFVSGPDGDYYLSHLAAGQDADSPCIDAGFGRARDHGLRALTTRTDGVKDRRAVDMGYHFPRR